MTANQIEYAKHLEAKRHNQASESAEKDKAQAQLSQAQTAIYTANETARHNREGERINWFTAQSESQYRDVAGRAQLLTASANLKQADVAAANAAIRQNELALGYAQLQLQQQDVNTRKRNALTQMYQTMATTAETKRHNKALESISKGQLNVSERDVAVTESLQTSRKFSSYAGGIRDLSQAVSNVVNSGVNLGTTYRRLR